MAMDRVVFMSRHFCPAEKGRAVIQETLVALL